MSNSRGGRSGMTATPPPVPPAPVGPPASGTLESSTPTPQQLAGTEKGRKTHTHTRYSLLRKNSLACQCESRLARVSPSSRFSGHHRPSVTEIRLIRLNPRDAFLAPKHVKCQVRLALNSDTFTAPRARIHPMRKYK